MNTKIEQNTDGTLSVPASGALIARVFSTAPIEQATAHALRLLGQDTFNALLKFIDECHGLPRDEVITALCESWQSSSQAIMPIIKLLKELPPSVPLKALIAQHVGQSRPELVGQIMPFYRTAAGLETRPTKGAPK